MRPSWKIPYLLRRVPVFAHPRWIEVELQRLRLCGGDRSGLGCAGPYGTTGDSPSARYALGSLQGRHR